MKSFHLQTESKGALIPSFIGLLCGAGLLVGLRYFQIEHTDWRIVTILIGAVFIGTLCNGQLCRMLRLKYPNARRIGLLAVGISILTLGVVGRCILTGADEGMFTLAFILPAGACIAVFVFINRKDPDVAK